MPVEDTTLSIEQEEIVRALAEPTFHPHGPAQVEHIQTHISHVFLAGPYVFKLKKAVRFPFLDFSTVERRRHFCAEELRLNRRLSPDVYLDVLEVVRRADGTLALGGDGDPLEPVLRMRRLPSDRMLPVLLERDAVEPAMLARLAELLVAFHAEAPTGPEVVKHASPEALRTRWDDTLATLGRFTASVLPADEQAILADFGPRFIAGHGDLFRARQTGGHVRDGHGDLHAEHVCFVDAPLATECGAPPLAAGIHVFDCIEFSEEFRCNDVASEIAFLTMDLEHRGRRDLADAFAEAYIAGAGDHAIASLLPFYASARACVRATVECLTSTEPEVEPARREAAAIRARTYLGVALRSAWRAAGPMIIACTGLSGSGKSTLAVGLANAVDAVVLRSDVIRKRHPEDDGPAASDRYAPAARAAVYDVLAAETDAALATGRTVIADATYLRRRDRDCLVEVARRRGVPCVFLECRSDEAAIRSRLEARRSDDVSDARWDTYLAQRRTAEPFADDEPYLVIETDAAPPRVQRTALQRLWRWRTQASATPQSR